MEDLRELFAKSGLTLNELSKLSGVSISTIHRYIHHKTKEVDNEHYSSLCNILKEYKDKNVRHNMEYIILLAERNMYKTFYDQIKEFYDMYNNRRA